MFRIRDSISDIFPILLGSRQGSKSSPVLYLLYINGLINELDLQGSDPNVACQTTIQYGDHLCEIVVKSDLK
jgi:hypothetical protein